MLNRHSRQIAIWRPKRDRSAANRKSTNVLRKIDGYCQLVAVAFGGDRAMLFKDRFCIVRRHMFGVMIKSCKHSFDVRSSFHGFRDCISKLVQLAVMPCCEV